MLVVGGTPKSGSLCLEIHIKPSCLRGVSRQNAVGREELLWRFGKVLAHALGVGHKEGDHRSWVYITRMKC